jgi:hypothetical protein
MKKGRAMKRQRDKKKAMVEEVMVWIRTEEP